MSAFDPRTEKETTTNNKMKKKLQITITVLLATFYISCSTNHKIIPESKNKNSKELDTNLKQIVCFDISSNVRKIATSKIKSIEILCHISKFDKDKDVKKTAIHILTKIRE